MPWTPEEKAAYMREWRANNVEHRRAYAQKYDAEHRPEARARERKHDAEHREEVNAAARAAYAALSPEAKKQKNARILEYHRCSYAKDPQPAFAKRRARRARIKGAAINDLTAAQWLEIQAAYDHRCVYCGKRRKGHLTQDHITPLIQGGSHTASNVVPACSSCNSKKHTGPVLNPVQPLLLTIAPSRKPKAP